jgi:hypothetical protein
MNKNSINGKKVDFMKSYYDWYIKEQEDKIHDEFKTKRQLILDASLDAGFNEKGKKDKEGIDLSAKYKQIDKDEQEAVNAFKASLPKD